MNRVLIIEDEKHLAEGLRCDRLQRSLLVRGLPADAEGELEGEDADEAVDDRAGDEARARQPLEAAAPDDLLAARASLPCRPRPGWRLDAHAT